MPNLLKHSEKVPPAVEAEAAQRPNTPQKTQQEVPAEFEEIRHACESLLTPAQDEGEATKTEKGGGRRFRNCSDKCCAVGSYFGGAQL